MGVSRRLPCTEIAVKRSLPFILDSLHALALALWLGGLVALRLVLPPAVNVAAGLPRFGGLVEICGLVMIGAQWLLRRRYQKVRPLFVADGVRQLLTFGALLIAEFGRYGGGQATFGGALAQIVLLIFIVALTAWLPFRSAQPLR